MSSIAGSPELLIAAVRRADLSAICAHPPLPRARDAAGHTSLHWAAMAPPEVLRAFLRVHWPADPVDVASDAGPQRAQTPLHWACVHGDVENVRVLVERGADPARVDGKGYNSVVHAAQYGHVGVLCYLLDFVPGLVETVDSEGHTLLQWASYYNHFPAVRFLLDVHGADPNACDVSGQTALHKASMGSHGLVAEALLRAGADLSATGRQGKTPAQVAPLNAPVRALFASWETGARSVQRPNGRRYTVYSHGFVLYYYTVIVVSYHMYQTYVSITAPPSLLFNIALHLLCVVSLTCHTYATYADPGDLPVGTPDDFIKYVRDAVSAKPYSVRRLLPSAYCYTCCTKRPPRSKHSRMRGRCVRRFDHDCLWTNNTIGFRNHHPLLVFVVTNCLLEWIFIYAVFKSLLLDAAVHSVGEALRFRPLAVALLVKHVFLSGFCCVLCSVQTKLVAKGLTTWEHMQSKRLEHQTGNPYDKGLRENVVSFLTKTGPGTGERRAQDPGELTHVVVAPRRVQSVDEEPLLEGVQINSK